MSDQFAALAPHLQGVVGALILAGSGTFAVVKFFRPFLDSLPKPKGDTAKTLDTVVISAALADSKIMADLAQSIDNLCEAQHKGNIINQMLLEAITRLVHKP